MYAYTGAEGGAGSMQPVSLGDNVLFQAAYTAWQVQKNTVTCPVMTWTSM